jgi:hypothetical protein
MRGPSATTSTYGMFPYCSALRNQSPDTGTLSQQRKHFGSLARADRCPLQIDGPRATQQGAMAGWFSFTDGGTIRQGLFIWRRAIENLLGCFPQRSPRVWRRCARFSATNCRADCKTRPSHPAKCSLGISRTRQSPPKRAFIAYGYHLLSQRSGHRLSKWPWLRAPT